MAAERQWRISVDYWDIQQENKIDECRLAAFYTNSCGDQDSPSARAARLSPATRWAHFNESGRSSPTSASSRPRASTSGASFAPDLGAGALTLGLEYSHLLEFERVELNFGGHGIRHP